jgi:hypothetical protein
MIRRLRARRSEQQPGDDPFRPMTAADERIVRAALPYTMTGVARLQALVDAVRHLAGAGVPGAFVECGVWRGGSVLAMILTLQDLGRTDRELHLLDTFEGMTEPGEHDTSPFDAPALEHWNDARERGERPWHEVFGPEAFSEEAVRATLLATGYPAERLHLVPGPVEQTLPGHDTGEIALLRLDTDWYESTRHELDHLYPRLVRGGVLIIDDYGHWEGARRAVDEFFADHGPPPLLHRIDYTARVAVKP